MNQDAADQVSSPCIRVCMVDGRTGFCRGCGRKLKEIAGWTGLTAAEREAVLSTLPERLEAMKPAD